MGADTAVVLAQTNSNDVTGERGGYVVGYSAVAFVASGKGSTDQGTEGSSDLTEHEQKSLLRIALCGLSPRPPGGRK